MNDHFEEQLKNAKVITEEDIKLLKGKFDILGEPLEVGKKSLFVLIRPRPPIKEGDMAEVMKVFDTSLPLFYERYEFVDQNKNLPSFMLKETEVNE